MSRRTKRNLEFRLSLQKFLSDDAIRQNLILTSLYIFAFEVLKNAILEDVKFILTDTAAQAPLEAENLEELLDWEQRNNMQKEAVYKKRLRDFDRKSKWKASYLFLADIGVISKEDVARIEEIKRGIVKCCGSVLLTHIPGAHTVVKTLTVSYRS